MHIPVLLQEVISSLNLPTAKRFIDGTAGGGGHIFEALSQNSKLEVLGIDLDQTSLAKLKKEFSQKGLDQKITLVHGNYADLKQIARDNDFVPVDAILIDLGFSSLQLDDPERGFSFQKDGPLDMRFSTDQSLTAAEVLNTYPEKKLTQIFKQYGEENFSIQIARAIVRQRQISTFDRTGQVLVLIQAALPKPYKHKAVDHARKIFQALRIEVNRELQNLKSFLPDAIELLSPGGRLAVISFHSLEDRMVKHFFQEQSRGCVCPPDFPTCVCGKSSGLKIVTRKPIMASELEQKQNSRSKSAKLRVAEKI